MKRPELRNLNQKFHLMRKKKQQKTNVGDKFSMKDKYLNILKFSMKNKSQNIYFVKAIN